MVSSVYSLLFFSSLAAAWPNRLTGRQVITPDNTCGGANGYTCNANDEFGGPCCSASGWCGKTDAYCGTGCQPAYSTNGQCSTSTTPVTWQNHKEFTFTGNALPDGLSASDWPVDDTPPAVSHVFTPANVIVQGGYLQLKVPGGQSASNPPLSGAEVYTTVANIKYASVKTTAILGESAGTCNGMFFYQSGQQESDIEWLSDPTSLSNNGQRWIHFTNQATDGNRDHKTYVRVAPPANPTTTEHEYRIDWLADRVDYYIDGVLQTSMTTNVPSVPGSWLWNNWANADPGWTGAPPTSDNIFKIKKIVMDYNTA